jgi:heterodisulfide reductase subunit A-like polyferredoxin
MKKGVLVIGGGISGIQASLDLADSGIQVYLVERSPSLGGRMAQLDKTFPTNDCAMCILSPKLVAASRHPNIELMTLSEVKKVDGEAGDFKVTVLKHSRFVDESKCVGCGECAEKCPAKTPNEFDMGNAYRKAIYVPFPQATPLKYSIDKENCLYFKMLAKGKEGACLLCKKACEAEAIFHDMKDEEVEIDVGSIIIATGFDLIDPKIRTEYGYNIHENVITSIEFERMLSASGPTKGKVIRFSDGETPKKIAFIQCYGSRDQHRGCSYCSRVCCMYSMKEAMIAKEHEKEIEDITLYYMDIRAYGKGFEDYFNRSKADDGINYFRGRPARILEDPTSKDLTIRVENTETGDSADQTANLVVLASAVVPSEGTAELAEILGVDLDDNQFFKEKQINTSVVDTNRNGIYICGCAQGPKDIPDSVAQASAAAVKAEFWVKDHRILDENKAPEVTDQIEEPIKAESEVSAEKVEVTEEKEELAPEPVSSNASTDINGPPRIGVFVCHCGSNIAGVVDVEAVTEFAKTLPNVAYATHTLYTCSDNTQQDIQSAIKENNLNRLVVAACSPRTHEPIFRETCEKAGVNQFLFEMANIRDQDSWIHMDDHEKATRKAKDLVRMAVAKSSQLEPFQKGEVSVKQTALIIGGGISGMTAALNLNSLGFSTFLVEKKPFLGGGLADRELLAPEYTPVSEILYQYYPDLEKTDIKILNNSKIKDIKGFVGNFEVDISQKGLGVDPEKCNMCGDCEKVCPVTVDMKYNENLSPRKAIWHKLNGFPESYAVDFANCTLCGECVKVCKQNCISLEDKEKVTDHHIDIGTITIAIGSDLYEPKEGEFGYKEYPNVITNADLERLLHDRQEGGALKLNGKELKKVALIHCVGSRETEGFSGCSRYCCQVALKQANELRDIGVEVVEYYRDIRAFSKGAEKLYQDTRLKGVLYFRYTPETKPEIFQKDDKLRIRATDTLYGQIVELSFDAIILSVGMRAKEEETKRIQEMLKIPRSADGFFMEKHPKLGPVETNTEGIYVAGCSQYPKDVPDSIAQASGTSAKAAIPLATGRVVTEGIPSVVDESTCRGCGDCIEVCQYNAINLEPREELKVVAKINDVLCKGCGTCSTVCCNGAIKPRNFTDDQIFSQIDALGVGE